MVREKSRLLVRDLVVDVTQTGNFLCRMALRDHRQTHRHLVIQLRFPVQEDLHVLQSLQCVDRRYALLLAF